MRVNVFEGARRISWVLGVLWVAGCVAFASLSDPYVPVTFAISGPGELPVKGGDCGDHDAREFTLTKTPDGDSVNVTLCFTASAASDGRMLVPFAIAPWENARRELVALIGQEAGEPLPPVDALWDLLLEADKRGDVASARRLADAINALQDAEKHAAWIVENRRLKGTPAFGERAESYRAAKAKAVRTTKSAADAGAVPAWMLAPAVNPSAGSLLMNDRYSAEVTRYTAKVRDGFAMNARDFESVAALRREKLWDQWMTAGLTGLAGLVGGGLLVFVIGWVVRGFLGIPRGRDSRLDA